MFPMPCFLRTKLDQARKLGFTEEIIGYVEAATNIVSWS
jgi:hypothetical protein